MTIKDLVDSGYLEVTGYIDVEGGVNRASLSSAQVVNIALKSESVDQFKELLFDAMPPVAQNLYSRG